MAEDAEGGGGGGLIATLFTALFDLVKEAFMAIIEIAPKIIKFVIWVVGAIFILPCVFVAGTIYPKWVEMGEEF